jgi:effector-binding domain-containing protein
MVGREKRAAMTQDGTRESPQTPTRDDHGVWGQTVAHQHAAVVRGRVPMAEIPAFLAHAFREVEAMAESSGVAITGPAFGRFAFAGDGMEVEAGFPVDREIARRGDVVCSDLPGGTAACVVHRGTFDQVAEAYEEVERWVQAHGYIRAGDPWEVYLDGPESAASRTLVCLPYLPAGTADSLHTMV